MPTRAVDVAFLPRIDLSLRSTIADEQRVEVQRLDGTSRPTDWIRRESSRAVVDRKTRLVVIEVIDALADRRTPSRSATSTLFRDDVDDTVCRLGAIECCGARSLED